MELVRLYGVGGLAGAVNPANLKTHLGVFLMLCCGSCALMHRPGTSCAFRLMALAAQCRGAVYNNFANEDAERLFHVPVTLSELPGTSDGIAGTWKCFSVPSTLAMWVGIVGRGCVCCLVQRGVCASSQGWGYCCQTT